MSEETIEDLRFEIIKKMLTDFPELRERIEEYLREGNKTKSES